MEDLTWTKGKYTITTDKSRLDIALIHDFLANKTYWAKNIPLSVVEKCIKYSLVFGIYDGEKQVGFCRIITDYSCIAYLADVFIIAEYQGKDLLKWLVKVVLQHPDLQGLRRFILVSKDAHPIYEKHGGFRRLQKPENYMEIVVPNAYGADEEVEFF